MKLINAQEAQKLSIDALKQVEEEKFLNVFNMIEKAAKRGQTQIECYPISDRQFNALRSAGFNLRLEAFKGDIKNYIWVISWGAH